MLMGDHLHLHPPNINLASVEDFLFAIPIASVYCLPSTTLTPDSHILVTGTGDIFMVCYFIRPFTSNTCAVTENRTTHLPILSGLYIFCSIPALEDIFSYDGWSYIPPGGDIGG